LGTAVKLAYLMRYCLMQVVVSGVTRRRAGAVQYSLNSVTRWSQAAVRHVTSDDLSILVSYSSIFQ